MVDQSTQENEQFPGIPKHPWGIPGNDVLCLILTIKKPKLTDNTVDSFLRKLYENERSKKVYHDDYINDHIVGM